MKTYRDALKAKLSERVAVNPRYSLRAFARDIGISPSYLSQVLTGTRGLTRKKAPHVFKRLLVSDADLKIFELEMKKEHSRTDKTKKAVQKQIEIAVLDRDSVSLAPQHFDLISGWFAVVLLHLFSLKAAPIQSRDKFEKFAADRLKLPLPVVQHTLGVFEELKLIRAVGKGYEAIQSSVWTNSTVPSASIRAFHKQMMEQAMAAIELQAMEERNLTSLQLAVKKSDVPELTGEISKFVKHILRKYGQSEARDADTVYGLNLQLFRLIENAE